MDKSETTMNLREDKSDTIIFFRPPNYYKDRVNEIVTERISIPETSSEARPLFSFIIADRSGDGMCCSWNGELDTGYTLYEGDPSSRSVIVDSKFESIGREVKTFRINGENESNEKEFDDPIIQIKVTLMLDGYPDETGYFITNSLGRRLFYVAPGTFTEQNGVVEKTYNLYAGLFTFNIIDTFGDGISGEAGAYRIDAIGDNNRPPLLTGSGNFMKTSSQAFLLEGERAQYPLHINFKAGHKPEEFGFSIYRLDRIEAVSSIASKNIGDYKEPYDDISEKLLVTRGGLYKFVFENSFFGVDGMIRINLGSFDPTVYKAIEYTVDTADTQNTKLWQVKLFADLPLPPPGNDARMLTLRIQSNRYSVDFEWIILSTSRPSSLDTRGESEIVAYGPLALRNESNETHVLHHETIMIPRPNGNQSYTMIVTSVDSFGTWGGATLELSGVQEHDGAIIHSERLETGRRAVFSFSLIDSGSASFRTRMRSNYILLAALTLFVPVTVTWWW